MPPYLLNFHYQLLDYIDSHKFISGNDLKAAFPDRQSRFPECLLYLFHNQIIHATPAADEEAYYSGKSIENDLPKHFHMDYHLLITDYGYFLMEQHQEHVTEMKLMREKVDSTNSIAISAQAGVNLANAKIESAKNDSKIAFRLSVLAILATISTPVIAKLLEYFG